MARKTLETAHLYPRRLLLCLYAPDNQLTDQKHYQEEFVSLVHTAGVEYEDILSFKLRDVDKAYFLTKGKREEVKKFCDEHEIEYVVCSALLTPLQERNLENILDVTIIDREYLILEIFRLSAHTAEGKVQVEMAHIEYLKTRMAGKGREFAQQEGRIGSRGPGETAKEKLRRFFVDRIRNAKKRLAMLQKSRETQRKRRLESKVPLVCLVGYTNAGKSSLLNILTKSEVVAEDKLFATLDTTIRELYLEPAKKILISDTVGFISQLPHHLIEAFKATLEELTHAHLILHVVDLSNPAWQDHIKIVHATLADLGVTTPQMYVFNKIDKISEEMRGELGGMLTHYTPHVITDAKSITGVASLLTYLKKYFE